MRTFEGISNARLYEIYDSELFREMALKNVTLNTTLEEFGKYIPTRLGNILFHGIKCGIPLKPNGNVFSYITLRNVVQTNILDIMNMRGMGEKNFNEFLNYMFPLCYKALYVELERRKRHSRRTISLDTSIDQIETLRDISLPGVATLGDLTRINMVDYTKNSQLMTIYRYAASKVHTLGYYMDGDFGNIILKTFLNEDKPRDVVQEYSDFYLSDSQRLDRLKEENLKLSRSSAIASSVAEEIELLSINGELKLQNQEAYQRLFEAYKKAEVILRSNGIISDKSDHGKPMMKQLKKID